MKRVVALVLVAVVLSSFVAACGTKPCSPEDEDIDEWGPTPAPLPGPGGPTDPGAGDDGESDGDAHGYKRDELGEVCACDLREAEEGGCSAAPPPACDPQRGWNIETGECAPPIVSDQPAPQAVLCKKEYWCCYSLRCDNGAKRDKPKHYICPRNHGEGDTRADAWRLWDRDYVTPMLKKMRAENPGATCWRREASCYEEPPLVCGNYPN